MKTMSLNEMLLYYYYEEHPEPSFWVYWGIAVLMSLGILCMLITTNKFSQLCCFIAFCSGGAAFFLNAGKIMCSSWRGNKFYHSLIKKAERLPVQKEYLAKKLYGWPEGTLSAIECEESHLPGDCPLCGAE
jgi:hypothetical protein